MTIADRQQQLFDLGAYAIERAKSNHHAIGDWEWEQSDSDLLPIFENREQPDPDLLPKTKNREQTPKPPPPSPPPDLLPISKNREQPDPHLLPKTKNREQTPTDRQIDSPRSITETSSKSTPVKTKQLPKSEIRELLEAGEDVPGYSICTIKGIRYLLAHSKSNKPYPATKAWLDRETKDSGSYLYARWREEGKQRTRYLGTIDRLD